MVVLVSEHLFEPGLTFDRRIMIVTKSCSYKGIPFTTAGSFPEVGEQAPNFTLTSSALEEFSLSSLKNVTKLINIVPSLELPTSIVSTSRFERDLGGLDALVTLVVSSDTPFTLNRFSTEDQIYDTKLLSAVGSSSFAEDYGVLISDGPLKGLLSQSVIILEKDNTVRYARMNCDISEEPMYADIMLALSPELGRSTSITA